VKIKGADVTSSTQISKNKLVVTGLSLTASDVVVPVELAYKGQADAEGNEIKTEEKTTFTVADDTTAPTASISVDKDNNIVVKFSERVDATQATNEANYEIKDKDGNVVGFTFVGGYDADTNSVTLNPTYADEVDNKTNGGVFSVKVKKDVITDMGVRSLKVAETTANVTVADQKSPTISMAALENEDSKKVRVVFSEAMNLDTISNAANYVFLPNSDPAVRVSDMTGGL
jgi:hypothetical protein